MFTTRYRVTFGLVLLVSLGCAIAATRDDMDRVIYDAAETYLPPELVQLVGRDLVTALDTIEEGCQSQLQQLDSLFTPATNDIEKEYQEALRAYDQEVNREAAQQLRDGEITRLKQLLSDAERARQHDRQLVTEKCKLRKQELFRNRFMAILVVVRDYYRSSPSLVLGYINRLQNYLDQLGTGAEQCSRVSEALGLKGEAAFLCQEVSLMEVVQFLRGLIMALPTAIRDGFPGLPPVTTDPGSSGSGYPVVVVDEGSATDVFEKGFPDMLMPGPVIFDPPFDDDEDILTGDAVNDNITISDPEKLPPEDLEKPTTTIEPSTDGTSLTNTGPQVKVNDERLPPGHNSLPQQTAPKVTTKPGRDQDGDHDHQDEDHDDRKGEHGVDSVPQVDQDDQDSDQDDDESGLGALYVALVVAIAMLLLILLVMIAIVLLLRRRVMREQGCVLTEDDKLSLMKEGYVNPTYKFFDKQQPAPAV